MMVKVVMVVMMAMVVMVVMMVVMINKNAILICRGCHQFGQRIP